MEYFSNVLTPFLLMLKLTCYILTFQSRPDLSNIRTCCKGYIRNIHNFRLCDPVCTKECINSLCTGPETCTCFPDHVKNLAGICVPTCPIGCQNGRCDGGECMCNDGYILDRDSKFCYPTCKDNCGGLGNHL